MSSLNLPSLPPPVPLSAEKVAIGETFVLPSIPRFSRAKSDASIAHSSIPPESSSGMTAATAAAGTQQPGLPPAKTIALLPMSTKGSDDPTAVDPPASKRSFFRPLMLGKKKKTPQRAELDRKVEGSTIAKASDLEYKADSARGSAEQHVDVPQLGHESIGEPPEINETMIAASRRRLEMEKAPEGAGKVEVREANGEPTRWSAGQPVIDDDETVASEENLATRVSDSNIPDVPKDESRWPVCERDEEPLIAAPPDKPSPTQHLQSEGLEDPSTPTSPQSWLTETFNGLPFGPDPPAVSPLPVQYISQNCRSTSLLTLAKMAMFDWFKHRWLILVIELGLVCIAAYAIQVVGL